MKLVFFKFLYLERFRIFKFGVKCKNCNVESFELVKFSYVRCFDF